MSRDKETPRINSSLLHKNIGRTVRLVGRLTLVNSQQAVLEASDKGQVNVLLAPGSMVRAGVIEILGRVESDMSVTELSSFMFNGDYDSESYDKMINIAASQPELFGGL
ncbi:hypothetical protein BASA50_005016 [Batrachochytrium salamandrivorans]|uniref:Replication factor A protein 3 n=1 Tax=Batrachochytrium salamandrivorans TaxID=1357716 RepID=A0ABQ8FDU6_9FUNG|nr:hypothetical protein BASA62_010319 [Batrachochytrium salamandrivorans]KAH6566314.1 hypothetical protein BASA60_009525 [Batrachochytrium salamandrivorans]KAH6584068.1 hypothetical protein BASA61_007716 [Batrachochytrium salamandrivorans]KAH6596578.1 hypothetical protein BASA50_005016 [Batrachochytrium salamandrivorans]